MKTKITFALFFLSTFFIQENLYAQELINQEEKYPETVVIKLIEAYAGGIVSPVDSRIVIIKPDNTLESVTLERSDIMVQPLSFNKFHKNKI